MLTVRPFFQIVICVYIELSNSLFETRLQACVASVSGPVACFGPTQENCRELLTLRVEGTTPQGCLNITLLKVQALAYSVCISQFWRLGLKQVKVKSG